MRAALEQVEHRHGGPARTIMVGGRCMTIDESQSQGEPQQQTEQAQEGEQAEETEQAPQP